MQTTVDEWGAAKKILRPGPPHLPPSDGAGIRSQRLPSSEVRHPAAARRRETGYCRPDVEGRRPAEGGGVLPPRLLRVAARPVRASPSARPVRASPSALRSAPLRVPSGPRLSECPPVRAPPVRTCPDLLRAFPACFARRYAKKRSSSSRAAMSDSAMRRLSFDLSV